MSIYSAEGLRVLAKLIDDQIEEQRLYSQNDLVAAAKITASTVRSIRKNRNITDEDWEAGRHYEPGLESVLGLANGVIDPLTGEPFGTKGQPCRFEKIVRGWEELHPVRPKKRNRQLDVPHAKAVAYILRAANKNPQAFADAKLPVDSEDFQRLTVGELPSTWLILSRLQTALGLELEEITDLYDLSPDSPIQPSGDKKKNGCANGAS
ncbi:hypothetical protein [Pantanalinema sp. GBBB05]|uniref:hypothetical protein n=1 Tax=Pantanalinema sp. GBBB05 TaxID=2604139 RepID=UPI001D9E4C73|nr:hypothetical protein [Pantanalinema sp. GBBB05]